MGKSLKKQRYINLFIKTKVAFPKKTRPAQELAKALIISAGTLNVTKISYEANQSGERKSSSPNIQISRRSRHSQISYAALYQKKLPVQYSYTNFTSYAWLKLRVEKKIWCGTHKTFSYLTLL